MRRTETQETTSVNSKGSSSVLLSRFIYTSLYERMSGDAAIRTAVVVEDVAQSGSPSLTNDLFAGTLAGMAQVLSGQPVSLGLCKSIRAPGKCLGTLLGYFKPELGLDSLSLSSSLFYYRSSLQATCLTSMLHNTVRYSQSPPAKLQCVHWHAGLCNSDLERRRSHGVLQRNGHAPRRDRCMVSPKENLRARAHAQPSSCQFNLHLSWPLQRVASIRRFVSCQARVPTSKRTRCRPDFDTTVPVRSLRWDRQLGRVRTCRTCAYPIANSDGTGRKQSCVQWTVGRGAQVVSR